MSEPNSVNQTLEIVFRYFIPLLAVILGYLLKSWGDVASRRKKLNGIRSLLIKVMEYSQESIKNCRSLNFGSTGNKIALKETLSDLNNPFYSKYIEQIYDLEMDEINRIYEVYESIRSVEKTYAGVDANVIPNYEVIAMLSSVNKVEYELKEAIRILKYCRSSWWKRHIIWKLRKSHNPYMSE